MIEDLEDCHYRLSNAWELLLEDGETRVRVLKPLSEALDAVEASIRALKEH